MISRIFKRGTQSGSIDHEPAWLGSAVKGHRWDIPLRSDARASGPLPNRSSVPNPLRKRARFLLLAALLACVPAMVVAFVAQFRVAVPLEKRLVGEEIRNLVTALDSMIDARSSAVKMSAGTLEIDNLSASGELNRILNNLKELFPDFLSMEICNDQGQTVAMMGDLALSRVGRKADFDAKAKTDTALHTDGSVFSDDPTEHAFSIVLKHRGTDGAVWFTRTRFSRDPLDALLRVHGANGTARLVAIAQKNAEDPGPVAAAEKLSHAGAFALTTNRPWWPTKWTAAAPLTTGGWIVSLERAGQDSSYLSAGLIVPAVLLLVSAMACLVSAATSRSETQTVPANRSPEDDLSLPTTAPPREAAHSEDDPSIEEILGADVLAESDGPVENLPVSAASAQRNAKNSRPASWAEESHLSSDETTQDAEFLGSTLCEEEFAYAAESGPFSEEELDLWESEPTTHPLPKPIESGAAGKARTPEALEPLAVASDESIPETLEVTWFEPDSEEARDEDPATPPKKKSRRKAANHDAGFVSC